MPRSKIRVTKFWGSLRIFKNLDYLKNKSSGPLRHSLGGSDFGRLNVVVWQILELALHKERIKQFSDD